MKTTCLKIAQPAQMAREEKPDLVLYGHSHLPLIDERDGIVWVNPGHLKTMDKKGAPPSYAVIDIRESWFHIRILALADDRVLASRDGSL